MRGGRGGAAGESWCSGTPRSTTGWKGAGRRGISSVMIDDATSQAGRRVLPHDSTEENLLMLKGTWS